MRRPGTGPTAQTTAGPVVGRYRAKGTISQFLGVPYAAPPTGGQRWRPPQPTVPWTDPRGCTKAGPIAFQRRQNFERFLDNLIRGVGVSAARRHALNTLTKLAPVTESEDCLTLNIRAPRGAEDLPVMVWIHGGDHSDGSGSDAFYASNALPERGCVLVTINYRLGMFGFLAHPELNAESPDDVSGNYGLLDQIAALEWVRDNIRAFGGDPSKVTIFGQSAGGQAVMNLMTAPAARGLFRGVIAQSPSDTARWLRLREPSIGLRPAQEAGASFADAVVGSQPGQIERLRRIEPAELSDIYREHEQLGRYFYPNVDGVVLPEAPMTAFSNGTVAQVPLMIGYNADEGTLLAAFMHPAGGEFGPAEPGSVSPAEARTTFEMSYGSSAAVDRLYAAYPGLASLDPGAVERQVADHMFGVHVDHASRSHAAAGNPTFRYHFRAVPASPRQTAGAFHAAEVFYVFGTRLPLVPDAPDAHLLSRNMGDRWFAFAATGVPDFPGRDPWPAYDLDNPQHMVFDRPRSHVEPCLAQDGLDLMRERIGSQSGRVSQPM